MTPIQKVAGIGQALAALLAANGISTAEQLAKTSPEDLRSIPRLGAQRASVLVAAAQKIVAGPQSQANAHVPATPVTGTEATPSPSDDQAPAQRKSDKKANAKPLSAKSAKKAAKLEKDVKKAAKVEKAAAEKAAKKVLAKSEKKAKAEKASKKKLAKASKETAENGPKAKRDEPAKSKKKKQSQKK